MFQQRLRQLLHRLDLRAVRAHTPLTQNLAGLSPGRALVADGQDQKGWPLGELADSERDTILNYGIHIRDQTETLRMHLIPVG